MFGTRRQFVAALAASAMAPSAVARTSQGSPHDASGPCPDPLYEKPAPMSEAEFNRKKIRGIEAAEVYDFSPCGFTGPFAPAPPHADLNPRKAIIVRWRDHNHRFVFSHEASYAPWIELPGGLGLCNQFFETNHAAELFNQFGRRERNSSVDIIESGPRRVWVRWNYTCVHEDSDAVPSLRGTEDYVAYPNGLVWRRLTYESLKPDNSDGYSWQPIDFFCLAPATTTWADLFPRDKDHGDFFVGSIVDAYADRRYDKFWDDKGKGRRVGDPALLLDISRSRGFAMVAPFKAGNLFTILGPASGFPSNRSQVVDHSFKDTGGWGWGAIKWDHWPVGWINSEAHSPENSAAATYPYSFGQFSHYIINEPIREAKVDFPKAVEDMELNRWTERHVYYTLTGAGRDMESIRKLARQWLDKGAACADPASVEALD